MLLLSLLACVHVVTVQTVPLGASVEKDGLMLGTGPLEIRVAPFGRAHLHASFPGYRAFDTTVHGRLFRSRSTVELRLSEDRPPIQ